MPQCPTWIWHVSRVEFWVRSDQSLSRVRLFATPWIAARQASLSITNSRSSPRLTSIESVMPSSHLILCRPLLLIDYIYLQYPGFWHDSHMNMLFQFFLYFQHDLFLVFILTHPIVLTDLSAALWATGWNYGWHLMNLLVIFYHNHFFPSIWSSLLLTPQACQEQSVTPTWIPSPPKFDETAIVRNELLTCTESDMVM